MEDEKIEQPLVEADVPEESADLSIEDILTKGLPGEETTPEVESQPKEAPVIEETSEVTEGDEPKEPSEPQESRYAEIVVGEQKIPFKTEEEFLKFVESNQMLKDGFSMQSDYTRKTQELAESRKADEKRQTEQDQAWGPVKPADDSLKALQSAWYGFQVATDQQAQIINSVLDDASRIGRGEQPVGMLAQLSKQSGESNSPELQKIQSDYNNLQTKLNRLEMEKKRETEQRSSAEKQQEMEKAAQEVDGWVKAMDSKGVKVEQEEFTIMGSFAGAVNPMTKKPYSFDELYGIARAQLGKTKVDATKEVIASTKEQRKKTVKPPSSKASAGAEPEANTIEDILEQGRQTLQGT